MAGDLLLFTDWRGDPDRADCARQGRRYRRRSARRPRRGVRGRGADLALAPGPACLSARHENRHLGEEIEAAGGQCLLRHAGAARRLAPHEDGRAAAPPTDPALRRGLRRRASICATAAATTSAHAGDPQAQPMADGLRRAPAVARRAGDDPRAGCRRRRDGVPRALGGSGAADPQSAAPAARSARQGSAPGRPLPPQLPDPPPRGPHAVQVLRTYPYRRRGYEFAPEGERSIARGYQQGPRRAPARSIYLEDQYLWSAEVVAALAERRCARNPGLHLIAVIPRFPDQDGRLSTAAESHRPRRRRRRCFGGQAVTGSPLRAERRGYARLRPRPRSALSTHPGPRRFRQLQPPVLDARLRAVLRGPGPAR